MTRVVFWSWLDAWGQVTDDWVASRFELWRRTALRSVQAQTDPSWRYALLCGRAHRSVTSGLSVPDQRVQIVHPEGERGWRRRLAPARLYVSARLDSDDRYHPNVVSDLKRAARRKRTWLRFARGYAWDNQARVLFRWHQASSPFYARVDDGRTFRSAMSVPRPSHNSQALAAARTLAPNRFVVTIHVLNTTTRIGDSCLGDVVAGSERERVIEEFGLMKGSA